MKKGLSVVLATYNEENNIAKCLASAKPISNEIIIVDGSSIDRTREIGKEFGAKVIKTKNHQNFHINKKKAIDTASFNWILQLDADEVVPRELAEEIFKVINLSEGNIEQYQKNLKNKKLFLRHSMLIEKRDGKIGDREGEYNAFFIPRLNYFLGKYLRFGGVYPDGVIRLIKNGYANLPAINVHEQMIVSGKVGWLENPLLHQDSPTFRRYLERNSRYIDLITTELKEKNTSKSLVNFIKFFLIKPLVWFLVTQIRHKGILDGYRGIIFSLFSALRFPRAYYRYITQND